MAGCLSVLVRFCVVLVRFLFGCCVVGRHLAFIFTYSPTSGNSLSRTKRFYDRLSLERARHGKKENLSWFLQRDLPPSPFVEHASCPSGGYFGR